MIFLFPVYIWHFLLFFFCGAALGFIVEFFIKYFCLLFIGKKSNINYLNRDTRTSEYRKKFKSSAYILL